MRNWMLNWEMQSKIKTTLWWKKTKCTKLSYRLKKINSNEGAINISTYETSRGEKLVTCWEKCRDFESDRKTKRTRFSSEE